MTKRKEPGRRAESDAREPLILLVDDFADNRAMYAQFLTFSGFRVAEAANGKEALARAAELMPDIVVMDLSLPVMDGWEATRRLKADKQTRDIPVVALSAHVMEGARKKATEAGCSGFLPKPCYPSHVSEELHRVLAAPRPSV
jgi:CheY-like chemotaxis protein